MPWTKADYPDSMKNLNPSTRNKAVEIANALLKDGHDEGSAIRIAISQAKKTSGGREKEAAFEAEGLVRKAYQHSLNKD